MNVQYQVRFWWIIEFWSFSLRNSIIWYPKIYLFSIKEFDAQYSFCFCYFIVVLNCLQNCHFNFGGYCYALVVYNSFLLMFTTESYVIPQELFVFRSTWFNEYHWEKVQWCLRLIFQEEIRSNEKIWLQNLNSFFFLPHEIFMLAHQTM